MQRRSVANRASPADEQAALQREASLRRIATLVAGGVTAGELFSAVAREVSVVLDAPVVTVDRYELEGDSPVSVVVASHNDAMFPVGGRWPLDGPGARAWIYETRRPVRIEDFSGLESTLAAAARRQGMSWVVGVPIIVDGAVWGNICAGTAGSEPIPDDAESRLADFTDLVSTAIANAENRAELADSEARASELAEQQAALRRVATLVARELGSEQFFSTVAREVASVLNVPGVLVHRFEAEGTILTVGFAFDSELSGAERVFSIGTRMPRDPGSLAAQVFDTCRMARVHDFSTLPGKIGDRARAAGLGSGCGGPIVVNGELWGLMCVFSPSGTVLPAETENRLHDFIELVATAIANYEARAALAASEARYRELGEEQAALRRVATLVARGVQPHEIFSAVSEEVGRVFGSHYSGVGRFEPDGSGVVIVGVSEGIGNIPVGTRWPLEDFLATTAVYRTGRPARNEKSGWEDDSGPVANSLRELGLVSTVAAPIVVEGNVWGIITVSDAHQRLPPDAEERVAAFTELVATAIANAESRAELAASEARARELANEQAALRRVATLVARGASPDELFTAVAEEVARIIDIPVVGIHRYEADRTVTTVGISGESGLSVGTRLRVTAEGIAAQILSTGRPSRMDDYSNVPRDAVREDLRLPMVGVPIVVEGSVWGFMVAAAKRGAHIPAGTEERLARFTELVATAVSNASTRTDLLTSRARVVSAADETRRRLERDLHDGIQQWLVALALRARKAAGQSAEGESAVQELSGLADDLVAVTDELREISRGIHPAILSDAGLEDALKALARRSAIPVDLDVSFQGRYDQSLESTVYYVVAESITNAVKHAQASTVTVRGGWRDGAIELEITDDGVGGADPRRGTGLLGLKDRVDTLGGTISFASPAGGAGTTIRVKLPADSRDGDNRALARSDEAASPLASG